MFTVMNFSGLTLVKELQILLLGFFMMRYFYVEDFCNWPLELTSVFYSFVIVNCKCKGIIG